MMNSFKYRNIFLVLGLAWLELQINQLVCWKSRVDSFGKVLFLINLSLNMNEHHLIYDDFYSGSMIF